MNPAADASAALTAWSLEAGDARAGTAAGAATFPPDLPVFAGHFPGRPLVPGVHQAALLAELVRRALGRPDLVLVAATRTKWLHPLGPGQAVQLQARWRAGPGHLVVDGQVTLAGTATCTARLTLAG